MGKNLLVGVSSKARKAKALYVGVGGKARKVKKVYVGVVGKARLVWAAYVKVTGITLKLNDKYADKPTITAVFTPSNATNQKVTWNTIAASVVSGIGILMSNDTTCVLSHTKNSNVSTILTATSADGVTVQYRVEFIYNLQKYWTITKI